MSSMHKDSGVGERWQYGRVATKVLSSRVAQDLSRLCFLAVAREDVDLIIIPSAAISVKTCQLGLAQYGHDLLLGHAALYGFLAFGRCRKT